MFTLLHAGIVPCAVLCLFRVFGVLCASASDSFNATLCFVLFCFFLNTW